MGFRRQWIQLRRSMKGNHRVIKVKHRKQLTQMEWDYGRVLEEICSWYCSNGKKWKGTKESHGEEERWEWKAGLKFNIKQTKKET